MKTDIYEGPLPLLVELARYNLVDVFLIKLMDLTEQYLRNVKAKKRSINELAEPLPLFGQLAAIKARGLLPGRSVTEEDEEVPISLEELERRLKEYEQFKTVAQLLAELHVLQRQHLTRSQRERPDIEKEDYRAGSFDMGVVDLMNAFTKVLEKADAPVYAVKAEPWTVEMKIKELRMQLTIRRQIRFLEIFTPDKGRFELVVTFLALLELMRQRVAHAFQEELFGDILIAAVEPAG